MWTRLPNNTWLSMHKLTDLAEGSSQQDRQVAPSLDSCTMATVAVNYNVYCGIWTWALFATGNWIQQGPKLIYTAYSQTLLEGSVETGAVGTPANGTMRQGVLVCMRSLNGTWAQQSTLSFDALEYYIFLGSSLALSRNGRTLVSGSNNAVFVWALSSQRVDSSNVWEASARSLQGREPW